MFSIEIRYSIVIYQVITINYQPRARRGQVPGGAKSQGAKDQGAKGQVAKGKEFMGNARGSRIKAKGPGN